VFANGMTGRELHNAYPLLYNACFYEAFAEAGVEPLVWRRSGWAGIQRFPVSWSGDQLCNLPIHGVHALGRLELRAVGRRLLES
jgi:alpha-D-xyloside xylohydrolase